MFSLRRLLESCRPLSRSLTIAAAEKSPIFLPSAALRSEISSPVKVVPTVSPVYLTMSSLIPPNPNEPPPSDNVVELDPAVFSHPIRRDILFLCVVHYRDSLRQGSANTKTRGEVRGSGRKIQQQKKTGKARVGDAQSPIRRGGGVVFGPKPRDFSTKLPRKVIEMGIRIALSVRLKENALGVVETLDWPGMKTNPLAKRIKKLGWSNCLLVTGQNSVPLGLRRACANIPGVYAITAKEFIVYEAMKSERIILDLAAVEWFETLGKKRTVENLIDN